MILVAASGLLYAAVIVLIMLVAGGLALFGIFLRTIQTNAAREGAKGVEPLRDRVLAIVDRAEALRARLTVAAGADGALTGRTADLAATVAQGLDDVDADWLTIHQQLQAARELQEGPGDLGGGQHLAAAELAEDPDTHARIRDTTARLEEIERDVTALEDATVEAAAALDRLAASGDPAAKARHDKLAVPPWSDPLTLRDEALAALAALESGEPAADPPGVAPLAAPLPVEAPPDSERASASE